MKTLFIFVIAIFTIAIPNIGDSQILPIINTSSQWKTIYTTLNGEVEYITKQGDVIYYSVGGQINKIENGIETSVCYLPSNQKIIQIFSFSPSSNLNIVTQENVYKINSSGNVEELYTVPREWGDTYKIYSSFIKNRRIVVLVSGYRFVPNNAKAYLLMINNQRQVDTIYRSVNNFLGQEVKIIEDTVSIEGSAYAGPCNWSFIQKETLVWNGNEFNFVSLQEVLNKRVTYVKNSDLSLTSNSFQFTACSWNGIEKYIEGNGEPHKYYSYHDSIYYSINGHGGWIPAETIGVDFLPLGGIKIGNNIIFYGPITSDINGNYTSVRLYSLSERSFQDIGHGLDAITTAWYGNGMVRDQQEIVLGSRNKIYIKRNKIIDTVSVQNRPNKILLSNYPNPFNPTTKIQYSIPNDGVVSIKVFDLTGKEVATLANEFKTAGSYAVDLNGSNLASGNYYYMLSVGNFTETKKMMLIK